MFHRYTEVAYLVATYRGEKMPSRKKMLSILVSSNCIDYAYPSPPCNYDACKKLFYISKC